LTLAKQKIEEYSKNTEKNTTAKTRLQLIVDKISDVQEKVNKKEGSLVKSEIEEIRKLINSIPYENERKLFMNNLINSSRLYDTFLPLSNILMVVLGILSYSEQKLLNRIKIENKKKQGNPPLYVIHNLQTYTTKKQVKDYIAETLLKSATFKLKEKKYFKAGVVTDDSKLNTTYFIEEFFNKEDKKLVVNHLILAMDGTEAGDYYNQFVYDFLSEQFTSQPVNEKFPVIDAVKEQCIETSKSIMVEPIDSFEDFEEIEDSEKKGTIIRLTKKDDKDRILKFKRCMIDELGFSSFFGTNFEPKYSCYKCIVDKKQYVCVKVEIPGNGKFKCKAEVKNNFWSILVNGEKILDIKDDIDPSNAINNREQGKFNLNIKLDTTEFQLASKRPEQNLTKSIEGLRCFYFPLIDDKTDSDDNNSDN